MFILALVGPCRFFEAEVRRHTESQLQACTSLHCAYYTSHHFATGIGHRSFIARSYYCLCHSHKSLPQRSSGSKLY